MRCMIGLLLCGLLVAGCVTAGMPAGSVRLLTEENPPLNYTAGGVPTGISCDIVRAIAARLGTTAAIEVLPWRAGYALAQGTAGTALFSTIMTEERRPLFKWVGPLAATEYILVARRGEADRFRTPAACHAARGITVIAGYAAEQRLRQQGYANVVPVPDFATAAQRLLDGEADLLAVSAITLAGQLAAAGLDEGAVERACAFSSEQYYLAFSPATDDVVIAAWQQALDELLCEGAFGARGMPGSGQTDTAAHGR